MIEVHFAGHLGFYAPGKKDRLSLPIQGNTSLLAILQQLSIPLGEITLAAINDEAVDLHTARVSPGDRVDLFAPVSGG